MEARAVTRVPPPPSTSVHRLPQARLVDRVEFLLERARGKRVIHLGFVDETRMAERVTQGSWLHGQLAHVARELVGVDASAAGVEEAQALGYEGHVADCEDADQVAGLRLEPADVVVAGELVEHLANPGRFLTAIGPLVGDDGELIVTTPNAHALTNVLAALLGLELVNSDHVGWQSWRTGSALLARHGFAVREVAYYPFPQLAPTESLEGPHGWQVALFNAYLTAVRPLYRLRPALADGLILVAVRTAPATSSASAPSPTSSPGR